MDKYFLMIIGIIIFSILVILFVKISSKSSEAIISETESNIGNSEEGENIETATDNDINNSDPLLHLRPDDFNLLE